MDLNMYILYNFIHLMKKSPWNLTGGKLEQQSIFSFQFTYIADSKKQEHSHLHHHGYELMQKESVWLCQLLCTEIFKKNVVWGLNICLLNCISKSAPHFLTYFDTNWELISRLLKHGPSVSLLQEFDCFRLFQKQRPQPFQWICCLFEIKL